MNIMKDLFIHLHIPKTGGTTLRDIIQRQYRAKKILMIPKLEESENILKEISTSQINQLKLIQGHLKYGIHNHFHRSTKYFAIIRDPINRVLSTYYYVLSQKNNPQNLSTSNNQMTIYDFVQSGVNPFLINGQTQLISGKTGNIDNPIIESEELFSLAKENIENEPDGFFLPPPKPRLHELFYIKGAHKSNIPVIPSRMSMLTKKINEDRGICFYCGQCSRACAVYADFSAGTCLTLSCSKKRRSD